MRRSGGTTPVTASPRSPAEALSCPALGTSQSRGGAGVPSGTSSSDRRKGLSGVLEARGVCACVTQVGMCTRLRLCEGPCLDLGLSAAKSFVLGPRPGQQVGSAAGAGLAGLSCCWPCPQGRQPLDPTCGSSDWLGGGQREAGLVCVRHRLATGPWYLGSGRGSGATNMGILRKGVLWSFSDRVPGCWAVWVAVERAGPEPELARSGGAHCVFRGGRPSA